MALPTPARQVHPSFVALMLLFVIPLTLCAFLLPVYSDYVRPSDGTNIVSGTDYRLFGDYPCPGAAALFSALAVAGILPLVCVLALGALSRRSGGAKGWGAGLALTAGFFAIAIPITFSLVFSQAYAECGTSTSSGPGPQTSFEGQHELGPMFPGGARQVHFWGPGLAWWASLLDGVVLTGVAVLALIGAASRPRRIARPRRGE